MDKFGIKTLLMLVTFIALMGAAYRILPNFPRLGSTYSSSVLSGCWLFATCGALIPVLIRQRLFSKRFWYVLVIISMIGTWSVFGTFYIWCEFEAKRSPHFPGLAGWVFLAAASIFAGVVSFVLGWIVPKNPAARVSKQL